MIAAYEECLNSFLITTWEFIKGCENSKTTTTTHLVYGFLENTFLLNSSITCCAMNVETSVGKEREKRERAVNYKSQISYNEIHSI